MSFLRALCTSLVLLTCVSHGNADLYTSSEKMVALAASEESLLQIVSPIPDWGIISVVRDEKLKKLAKVRRRVFNQRPAVDTALHPNGAYYMLQAFLKYWNDAIDRITALKKTLSNHRVALPKATDLSGAIAGILRLQRVYNLKTSDMYAGNYSGFLGPALAPRDAFAIGQQAFTDGFLRESIGWLQLAANEMEAASRNGKPVVTSNPDDNGFYTPEQRASVVGLLGRAHIYKGNEDKAKEMYKAGLALDRNNGEVTTLAEELVSKPHQRGVGKKEDISRDLSRLCSRPKHQLVDRIKSFNKCRYKRSLYLPYVRYKEEILSIAPYASIFYDVISDFEIEFLKNKAKIVMAPGRVESDKAGPEGTRSYVRNSDLAWLHDTSTEVYRLSQRVQDITWLKTENTHSVGPWSSEFFQVVNYGIGGHYNVHMDILDNVKTPAFMESGVRIATFLIYLADVEIGGYTVFPNAGISVPPVKGSALFWYNIKSSQVPEPLTLHAGCPVVKGHKWVSNKWIWTYGNTFRSPCGPMPNSTQADVEPITYSRRHSIFYQSLADHARDDDDDEDFHDDDDDKDE